VIGSVDLLRSEANFNVTYGYPARDWQNYLDNYFNKNPINPIAFRSSAGDILCRAHAEDVWQKFVDAEIYRGWAGPLGMVDIIQGTLDKSASGIAVISCARHESVGVATDAELRRMRMLLPHLRRAVLISKALDLRTVQAAAFADTIDGIAAGVFLVSPQGELVHANARGQAMLDKGEPLRFEAGTLIAADAAVQASLQKAFADSVNGDAAIEANGMALPLRSAADAHYIAHVLPLASGARLSAGAFHSAAAALFVREAKVDLAVAVNAAAKLYGLTPAEERVARAIVELGGIAPVASLTGMSESTVKKQLEHVFEKTGTRRQAELVKLIAGFDSPARGSKPTADSS
jgi:DNA-binding CsgD family transcriptional regulator